MRMSTLGVSDPMRRKKLSGEGGGGAEKGHDKGLRRLKMRAELPGPRRHGTFTPTHCSFLPASAPLAV